MNRAEILSGLEQSEIDSVEEILDDIERRVNNATELIENALEILNNLSSDVC